MSSDPAPDTEEDLYALATACDLAEEFKCTDASALLSVKRHFTADNQDLEACRREMKAKRCGPSLVAIDIFGEQKKYTYAAAKDFYPVTEKSFTFFAPEFDDVVACEALNLRWRDVKTQLNKNEAQRVDIVILRGDDATQPTTSFEEQYVNLILKEEIFDPVTFISFMDGWLPFADYCGARASGMSAEELDKQMIHSLGSQPRLPAVVPTYEVATTRAPRRKRIVLTNSPITAIPSRQDKWNAQQLLKAHGLNYLRSVHASRVMEAEKLRVAKHIMFPVVVKPVSGAGSEFVTLCHSSTEMATAFNIAKGSHTTQNTEATHMTVEEYIDGPEYVVNLVSYNGVAVVTDVWRSFKYPASVHSHRLRASQATEMQKKHAQDPLAPLPTAVDSTSILYDHQEFISDLALLPETHEARRVTDYTIKCAAALGMRNGASHCEVRVDARPDSPRRGQPVLIELNPRVLGDVPRATHLLGYNQVTLLLYLAAAAAAFREPRNSPSGRLLQALPWPPVPQLYTNLATRAAAVQMDVPPVLPVRGEEHTVFIVFLTAPNEGVLCGAGVHYVSALPTFVRVARGNLFDVLGPTSIATVRRTTDLFSSPGACVFEGPRAAVERDVKKLRTCERTEFDPLLEPACHQILDSHKRRSEAHREQVKEQPSSSCLSYKKGSSGSTPSEASEVKTPSPAALVAALKAECRHIIKNQDPPPLYVAMPTFELLRQCALATDLHV